MNITFPARAVTAPSAVLPAATPPTRAVPGRLRGRARRVLDGVVVAVLGGLGGLGTVIGTGLSLIGLCCAGPALAVDAATTLTAATTGTGGVVLLAGAALLARRQHLLARLTATAQACRVRLSHR